MLIKEDLGNYCEEKVEIDPNPYLQGKTSSPRNQISLGHRNKMTKPINQTYLIHHEGGEAYRIEDITEISSF
ncbi:hypothetical protein GQ457_04G033920 [Hibiscus cannabinus]